MSFVTVIASAVNFISRAKKREKLFSFFKYSICFFLPIVFITHEFFIMKFGVYRIITDNVVSFCATNPQRPLFAFMTFGITFGLAYAFEKYLLPIIGLFSGKYEDESVPLIRNAANKAFMQGFGATMTDEELEDLMTDFENERFEFYSFLSFIPVCLLLWITFLSLHYSLFILILLFPVFWFHWWVLRLMNSALGMIGRP